MFVAQVALGVGLVDGVAQPARGVHRLAADVDDGEVGPDRVGGDDDALDERVRVGHHQRQVLAGARLALVGVDHEVVRLAVVLRDEGPLHAGGEAGAAPAAQAGVLDQGDQVVGVGGQRLAQRGVAVQPLVGVDGVGVRGQPALGEHRRELGQGLLRRSGHYLATSFCGVGPSPAGFVRGGLRRGRRLSWPGPVPLVSSCFLMASPGRNRNGDAVALGQPVAGQRRLPGRPVGHRARHAPRRSRPAAATSP